MFILVTGDFSPLSHSNTLSSLVEESGCPLEHPKAATFRSRVIAGEWDLVSRGSNEIWTCIETLGKRNEVTTLCKIFMTPGLSDGCILLPLEKTRLM